MPTHMKKPVRLLPYICLYWYSRLTSVGAIETNIYFERLVNNGEEQLELVRCPYKASNHGLAPAATSRAVMVSLLMSLTEVRVTQ